MAEVRLRTKSHKRRYQISVRNEYLITAALNLIGVEKEVTNSCFSIMTQQVQLLVHVPTK